MSKVKQVLLAIGIAAVLMVTLEAVSLVRLRSQVDRYATYWSNRWSGFLAVDVGYIALGDSTAQGIGASSPQKGYVGLIETDLRSKNRGDFAMMNISKSGAKLKDVIKDQLPLLKNTPVTKQATVTLSIGANDMPTYDHAMFADQIETIFSQLPSQTIVADVPYFGGGRAMRLEKNVLDANQIIYAAAAKYHLKVAPVHAIIKQRGNLFVTAADFFHPNNRGYRNWYDAFKTQLP